MEALEQIAALPMSSAESRVIKPLIEAMDNFLREWISADKDVKGDSYALKKMMVIFFAADSHFCESKLGLTSIVVDILL